MWITGSFCEVEQGLLKFEAVSKLLTAVEGTVYNLTQKTGAIHSLNEVVHSL